MTINTTTVLTTLSDESLWPLSRLLIPRLLETLQWTGVHLHFFNGRLTPEVAGLFPNCTPIPSEGEFRFPSNRSYTYIANFVSRTKFRYWLHFDGDIFVVGKSPADFIRKVQQVGKSAKLHHPHIANLRHDGTVQWNHFSYLSSQAMFLEVEQALLASQKVIRLNPPASFECFIDRSSLLKPCEDSPVDFAAIHCHIPGDASHGLCRLHRLKCFLEKWQVADDWENQPRSQIHYDNFLSMTNFRASFWGMLFSLWNPNRSEVKSMLRRMNSLPDVVDGWINEEK